MLSGGCVVGKSFVYLDEDVCTVVTSEDQPCISTQKLCVRKGFHVGTENDNDIKCF